ncbi:hypothetical protein Dimus_016294 [Dionaea muscipula]
MMLGMNMMITSYKAFLDVQATPVKLLMGSLVWLEDPEVAWMDGEVLEVNGQEIKVSCTNQKIISTIIWNIFSYSIIDLCQSKRF